MTNFFGSVMETIHTDSPYQAFSGKGLKEAKPEIYVDRSNMDIRRTLKASEVSHVSADPNAGVRAVYPCRFYDVEFYCYIH